MERTRLLLLMILLLIIAVAAQTNFTTDQYALLALKSHITSDPQNILTTNWSTSDSICNWAGVTCGVRPLRVTALNLSYMGLTGTIPPHLGNLSFLVQLEFRNNSFHGTLPQELSHLRRLELITFSFNNFIGTIPSWFGSLSKLQTFSLYGNQFSGSIPVSVFNLSALQVLDLRDNQLSGTIPREIEKLTMLKEILLGRNNFTGTIAREIGNLTMLKEIYLDYNKFEEIPNLIGSKDQVERLYMQFNALKGPVPLAVFNMSSLITLALSVNSLNGSIPDNICQRLPSIRALNLARNQLEGPLPSQLWQCKELLTFSFWSNNFSGSIPKSIGNLTQLTQIDISYNNLKGTIPDEIHLLQNLQTLSLYVNNLTGPIPFTIFNMSSLRMASFSINQLSGSLPSHIGLGVPNLEAFYVADNKLIGVIPNFISNGSKLTTLDMSANSFSGFIPSNLCALTNLEWLSLAMNNLTVDTSSPEANILSCLPNLRNLGALYLAMNPLNATFPVSFGNLSTTIQQIKLSYGNMRGNIPNDIGNLSSLAYLDLRSNQLSGSIPTSVARLRSIQGLYLNDNRLHGCIPYELCQLDHLAQLVLGGNQLSGSIPTCFGNLTANLRALSLGSNLLTSTVPSTLWELRDILLLDLSSNLLNGSILEDIGKLKVVIALDLSNNQLSGTIPSSIGGLQNLVNISLANNHLEGPIPISFGNLLSLELLYLFKNNLSGVIPKSLDTLLHLKYLNLSFNGLEGEIPNDGPFQNFSAQSFFSNGALCGAARFQVPPCENSTRLPHHSRKISTSSLKYIIPLVISTVFLVAFILMLRLRRKRKSEVTIEANSLPQLEWRRVSRLELLKVTNGFSENNFLGAGSFGSVYRGMLFDGTDVAIKVFNLEVEGGFKSFDRECEMLSIIRQRNLIKVISCCSEIDFKALVLQYIPNGSLEKWLYSQNCSLDILERLNILGDVASALQYLHHGSSVPIVHCDLKPSNILVDNDMVAHVADFGISKLLGGEGSMTQTMTLATIGYMAPEYGREGIVSTRGDVYSFGIVVMEAFTRRKPTDDMFIGDMNIKQWVTHSLLPDAAITQVVDANLFGTQPEQDDDFEIKRDCLSSIMRLALTCSADSPEERISMHEVVVALNKIKTKFFKDTAGGMQ